MSNQTKIIVRSRNVNVRTITSKRTGQHITFREQRAALDNGADFPQPFNVNLDDDQQPYPEGDYTIDPACLVVGEFDRLGIGRLKLLPLRPLAVSKAV